MDCKDNRHSNTLNVHLNKVDSANLILDEDANILSVNIKKSVVEWKGTKLLRTGKHEGIVSFKDGQMSFSNGKLVGGKFVVDMKSIYITDIPKSDPEPRKNLTTHLNKDFETKIFPIASFTITSVEKKTQNRTLSQATWLLKAFQSRLP